MDRLKMSHQDLNLAVNDLTAKLTNQFLHLQHKMFD